jgi:predicted RNA polymerase sigma factor
MPIRRDLCDEARRLSRMLAAHPIGEVPAVHALLALMCFHGAHFDARVALDGDIVLLEEQDRSVWNWSDVREGMAWLARSAVGRELTRYHVEAGIAWELANPKKLRVIAESTKKTDRLDAQVLAEFLARDMGPQSYIPTPRQCQHRALVRYRQYIRGRMSAVRYKLRRILSDYAVALRAAQEMLMQLARLNSSQPMEH